MNLTANHAYADTPEQSHDASNVIYLTPKAQTSTNIKSLEESEDYFGSVQDILHGNAPIALKIAAAKDLVVELREGDAELPAGARDRFLAEVESLLDVLLVRALGQR